jgi:rare lipoprotein A
MNPSQPSPPSVTTPTPAGPPEGSQGAPRARRLSRHRRRVATGGLLAGLAAGAAAVTLMPTSDGPQPAGEQNNVSAQTQAQPRVLSVPAAPRRPALRASRGGVRTAPLPMHRVTRTVPVGASFSGQASWYGGSFQGLRTASGEPFNSNDFTAASKTLPFGTLLRVCHSGCVVVRVNDRGPYVGSRILDLSRAAAHAIGYDGVVHVTATPVGSRAVLEVDRRALVRQHAVAVRHAALVHRAAVLRAQAEARALAVQAKADAQQAAAAHPAADTSAVPGAFPMAALAGGLVLAGTGGLLHSRRRRTRS